MPGRRWTDQEDNILRDLYKVRPIDELSGLLSGRSVRSIFRRAKTLGVVRHTAAFPWSQHETDRLRDLWPLPLTEVRNHFPHWKVSYVRQRARDLALAPTKEDKARAIFKQISLVKLEEEIVKPGIEKHLTPLLHFRGSANLGRVHRFWNLILSMRLHECESIREGINLHLNGAHAQLCLPPARLGNTSFYGFLSRLQLKPNVTNNVPGLLEYVNFLFPQGPFHLTPVDPLVYDHPGRAAWWRRGGVRQRKIDPFARDSGRRVSDVRYPFLIHEPKESSEHELLTLVDGAVPKGLPEQFRADICQDLIVALLTGDITKDEVKGSVQDFTRKMFKMFPTKYGALSLDAPAPWMDDGRALAETLSVGEVY